MAIALDLIQGNILKPFARPHARYLFLQFHPDAERVRPRLQSLLEKVVTSASWQAELSAHWKEGGRKRSSESVGMFGLSFGGYQRLGFPDAPPRAAEFDPDHFEPGMRAPRSGLWQPNLPTWRAEYRDYRQEAFLLLCDDDPERLEESVRAAKIEIVNFGTMIVEEKGDRLPVKGAEGDAEPFGFRDGVATMSNPESVLTQEPDGGYGCFATYAKFEQDVPAFHRAVAEIVAKAKASGLAVTDDEVAALAVGRKPDGTPLVPPGLDGMDDFMFTGVSPSVCPMHAHIRALNRRDGPPRFQIARRGIPYRSSGAVDSDAGLLFLALHRVIGDFISLLLMSSMAIDPILAKRSELTWMVEAAKCNGEVAQRWPIAGKEICHPMMDLVTLLGGEFFYIPSINFIRSLA